MAAGLGNTERTAYVGLAGASHHEQPRHTLEVCSSYPPDGCCPTFTATQQARAGSPALASSHGKRASFTAKSLARLAPG